MATLIDIFGYLSVLINALGLVATTLALGSVSFLLLLARPLSSCLPDHGAAVRDGGLGALRWSALATVATALGADLLGALVLAGTLDLPPGSVAGAAFVQAGLIEAAAALGLALLSFRGPIGRGRAVALALLALTVLAAMLGTSHAVARPGERWPMLLATAAHMAGAALWLGGLPAFLAALGATEGSRESEIVGARYSQLSIAGVALIVAGAVGIAIGFIGDVHAVYGTAYGAMAATKGTLMACLLLLGLGNFLAIRRARAGGPAGMRRVRRFVEVEIALGVAVLLAASSITSQPPAIDLTEDRATWAEVVERMTPRLPRLETPRHEDLAIPALQARLDGEWRQAAEDDRPRAFVPGAGELPPRNAFDIAWSEYNHHWAGLVVLLIGLAASAERTGRAPWATHWPLLFLVLALFLFVRSDPENWPLGDVGFWESFKDPEVVQHRIFVVLIIAFAGFEWGVRTGRLTGERYALVFPVLTAIGGGLLLTHSHAISNIKEQLLIELSHLALGVMGVIAGAARWMEIRAEGPARLFAGWTWPICFILIGLLLMGYREA